MKNDNMPVLSDEKRTAMDRALQYLGYRMRTENELNTYLKKYHYSQEEIDDVMERLKEFGYVDDKVFCSEFIRQKNITRPTGRRKFAYDLMRKGIDNAALDEALGEYSVEAEQEQCDIMANKLISRKGSDRKALASVQRALASRGFSYDMIRRSIENVVSVTEEWE